MSEENNLVEIAKMKENIKSNQHRLDTLENKYDELDKRQDITEKTVIEIKKDTEKILEYSKVSKDRWAEFDEIQRKNANTVKMEILIFIILAFLGTVLAMLGFKK